MKAYKVTNLNTGETKQFKQMKKMCEFYGWDYSNFRNKKSLKGLPMTQGKNSTGGIYTVTEIEIL